jgi:chromosome segregation ATPase
MASTDDFFATLSLREKQQRIEEANRTLAKLQSEIQSVAQSRDQLVAQNSIASAELKRVSDAHSAMSSEMVGFRNEREAMKADMEAVIEGISHMLRSLS